MSNLRPSQALDVPEHLPGEPVRERPSTPIFVMRVLLRVVWITLLFLFTAWLWPLYFVAAAWWGWPPNVPRAAQIRRYLRLTWTVDPPPPGLPVLARVWLTLSILRKVATIPIWGLAWLLDELLYGAALRDTPVVAPLIEISAARSGSTQLARYLELDPHLAAPSLLQFTFPYLWMWRLAPHTLGRVLTPEKVRHKIEAMLPEEFLQRHEGDPFQTDTFDGALYLAHLNHLSPFLGPEVLADDFGFARLAPHNRALWEEDFVEMFDRIGRKTLLAAGPGPDGGPRRLFVKGHFLCAGDALERRYPNACFLTMVREPAARLQSAVNYLRANPVDSTLAAVPWPWLGQGLARTETDYCEIEMAWFTRPGGARKCVVRFVDYLHDLEGVMARIYRECLDIDVLPAHVPRAHTPRVRTNYLLNRSLAQVGIDEGALRARLAPYTAWVMGDPPRPR